ncbi:helix-turn-helix domain-containing protein [Streptomyces sp. SAS_270]|uniref:helix-turn-helix domain-containing protein n=1 Tax=Streptomyces sp. SAS_270 TaxID=3412748 RepID=UPI00403CB10E
MTDGSATPLPSPKERRRRREAKSLSRAEVAARMGVTRETVRSWETGRTTPRGRRLEAYAELLGTPEGPPADTDADMREAVVAEVREVAEAEVSDRHEATVRALVGVGGGPSFDPLPAEEAEAEATAPAPADMLEPLTPAQAFDALYAFCAPALVRQTYLLTGRRELARESVERAFQLAWHRWPEVAVDRDPAGWVRATAYEYALSPWHRLRPRHRHPEAPPADAAGRALLGVLLQLPPPYRRTLLLYDGVGLDLPETAAETEASTPAAANRLLYARQAVAARLPELAVPEALHQRLTQLAGTERLRAAKPRAVRTGSERRARQWTRAAVACTALLIGITALTLREAPDHYEAPVAPGAAVRGVPPRAAPGALSEEELELRAKLRSQTAHGPERLVPQSR